MNSLRIITIDAVVRIRIPIILIDNIQCKYPYIVFVVIISYTLIYRYMVNFFGCFYCKSRIKPFFPLECTCFLFFISSNAMFRCHSIGNNISFDKLNERFCSTLLFGILLYVF